MHEKQRSNLLPTVCRGSDLFRQTRFNKNSLLIHLAVSKYVRLHHRDSIRALDVRKGFF